MRTQKLLDLFKTFTIVIPPLTQISYLLVPLVTRLLQILLHKPITLPSSSTNLFPKNHRHGISRAISIRTSSVVERTVNSRKRLSIGSRSAVTAAIKSIEIVVGNRDGTCGPIVPVSQASVATRCSKILKAFPPWETEEETTEQPRLVSGISSRDSSP